MRHFLGGAQQETVFTLLLPTAWREENSRHMTGATETTGGNSQKGTPKNLDDGPVRAEDPRAANGNNCDLCFANQFDYM